MKKLSSLLLIASLFATSCSKPLRGSDNIITQQKHGEGPDDNPHGGGNNTVSVPAVVLSAFHSRYPDAKNIEWKKLSDGNFRAEFLRGTVKWEATFTPGGILVKEEHN